jgi:hypothetical protein
MPDHERYGNVEVLLCSIKGENRSGVAVRLLQVCQSAPKTFIRIVVNNIFLRVVRILGAMLVPLAIGEKVLAAMACLLDTHIDRHPVDDPIFFLGDDDPALPIPSGTS